jgi:uncharacterized protein YfaS (alpha-2-macroglobulin family)
VKPLRQLVEKMKANRRQSELAILVILFAISGLSILYMRHSRSVTATQDDLAEQKVEKQESSTKLAFIDEKKMPKTYKPGEKLTLFFSIQNHEGKTMDYLYTVLVNGQQAAAHSLTVKNKTTQNVEQAFALPTDQQTLDIQVKLPSQNQSIHFSMERAK